MSERRKTRTTGISHPMPPVPIPPSFTRNLLLGALRWKIKLRYRLEVFTAFRNWLRGVGAAGILFAVVGLMQTFFWWSVLALYASLTILALDVLIERMNFKSRAAVLIILVGTAVWFTDSIVLHNSPIDLSYITDGTKLDLIVSNDSPADDYTDVDLTIIPAPRVNDFIGSFQELTPGTPCNVISSPLQLTRYPTLVMATPSGYAIYQSAVRLRCDILPHQDMVEFEVHLVSRAIANGRNVVVPVTVTTDPEFTVSFAGKFRNINTKGSFKREK